MNEHDLLNDEPQFTLDNGVYVSNSYARSRIIASLRVYAIDLDERRIIADYIISPTSGYKGYTVGALTRAAAEAWVYDKHLQE